MHGAVHSVADGHVQVGPTDFAMRIAQSLQQEHAAAFGAPPLSFEIIGIALGSEAETAHGFATLAVGMTSAVSGVTDVVSHFGLHVVGAPARRQAEFSGKGSGPLCAVLPGAWWKSRLVVHRHGSGRSNLISSEPRTQGLKQPSERKRRKIEKRKKEG
jgi:hypothetical protein